MSIYRTLVSEKTPEGGVIRIQQWPEGYELWYHGQVVWRSPNPKQREPYAGQYREPIRGVMCK